MRQPLFYEIRKLIRLAMAAQKTGRSPESLLGESVERIDPTCVTRRQALQTALAFGASLAAGPLFGRSAGAHSIPIFPGPPLGIEKGEFPIVILGAGVAGLTCAYRLAQGGVSSAVFERSPRVGGRMFTRHQFTLDGMFCELGGEFVDSNHADLLKLCRELGLETQALMAADLSQGLETNLFCHGGVVRTSRDFLRAFAPLAAEIANDIATAFGFLVPMRPTYLERNNLPLLKFDQMSLHDYLYSKTGVEKWVLDFLNTLYVCEFGQDTESQTALNLLTLISTELTIPLKLLGSSDEALRIKGGSSALTDALAHALNEVHIPRFTNHELLAVRQTDRRFVLTFAHERRTVDVKAARVVCTLPLPALRRVDGLSKLPFHPLTHEWIQNLGYGSNSKVMMGFKSPHWRKSSPGQKTGSNGSLITLTQHQFWETSRGQSGNSGILTQFTGGNRARNLDGKSEIQRNLEVLDFAFPNSKRNFTGQVAAMNWQKVPGYWSSYSCYAPGQMLKYSGLPNLPELGGQFLFAGEHTSVQFGGFMNGAVETGQRAAQRMIADF